MRAYIITTADSERVGRKADLTNYPDTLPVPELFYGVTPADVTTPQWWLDSHRKHRDNAPERVYCCNLSKVLALKNHLERYPGEDVLLMEDDVIFYDGAGVKYDRYRAFLPDNWGLQFLGGWHEFTDIKNHVPREIAPGVVTCNNVLGSEAVIIRAELIQEAIDLLTITPDNDYYICDWQLVNMQRRHCAYAPLGFIAYQQDGFSLLWQKRREWGEQIHRFYYIGMDDKLYYY